MTKAAQIAATLCTRLEAITQATGYATDAGLKVFRGKRHIDPTDLPCLILVENDDQAQTQNTTPSAVQAKVRANYTVEAHSACDPNHPNDIAHDLIGDIKHALFAADLLLDNKLTALTYTGRTITPREAGLALVVASVSFSADYVEDLRNP